MSKVERLDAHGNVIETLTVTPNGTSLSIGGGETATLRVVLEPGDKPVTLSRRDAPVAAGLRLPISLERVENKYASEAGSDHPDLVADATVILAFTVPFNVTGEGLAAVGLASGGGEQTLRFDLYRNGVLVASSPTVDEFVPPSYGWQTSSDMTPGNYEMRLTMPTTDGLMWRIEAQQASSVPPQVT